MCAVRCAGHWLQNYWFVDSPRNGSAAGSTSMWCVVPPLRTSKPFIHHTKPPAARAARSRDRHCSTDSRFAFAPQAQTDGAGVWPIQQPCDVQPPVQRIRLGNLVSVGMEAIAAPCCGLHKPPYMHRSRFACSMRVPLRRGGGFLISVS